MYKFNIKTMTTKEELEWLDFKKSLVHFFPGGIELKIKTDINFSNNYEPKVFSNINKEQLIKLLHHFSRKQVVKALSKSCDVSIELDRYFS